MDRPLLNDKEIPVSNEVLQQYLGNSSDTYNKMLAIVTGEEYGLIPEWRYYNDGKVWLCKVVYKKKTIFWLSVWDGFFKAGFYFVERQCQGIHEMDISENIKKELKKAKPFGTLYPVGLVLSREEHIPDLLKLIEYKKKVK